jgi:hypothetical protein
MAAWAVIAVPLLIMFFALGMERVEARLRAGVVDEKDVEAFLEQARPSEVRALVKDGIGRALELFRIRRRSRYSASRSSYAITAEEQTTEIARIQVSPVSMDAPTERIIRPRSRAS